MAKAACWRWRRWPIARPVSRGVKTAIGIAALLGLALFYGDGMLTPAISVLSAVEGLSVGQQRLRALGSCRSRWSSWSACFCMQSRGTEKIGKLFGPVMVVWFIVHRRAGRASPSCKSPQILRAANPLYGLMLFAHEPWTAFVALGSVVLAVTGCEALYADMGHFGARAIRWAWLYFAFPALVLNYFGQGALLAVATRATRRFLFYRAGAALGALSAWWRWRPMATIIASPGRDLRRLFHHPPGGAAGPVAAHGNPPHLGDRAAARSMCRASTRMLGVGVVLIVLIFKIFRRAGRGLWHRGDRRDGDLDRAGGRGGALSLELDAGPPCIAVFGVLGLIDLAFLASNALKIVQGGWLPLAVAAAVFVVMDTWRVGRRVHLEKDARQIRWRWTCSWSAPTRCTQRVAGTAVFLSAAQRRGARRAAAQSQALQGAA